MSVGLLRDLAGEIERFMRVEPGMPVALAYLVGMAVPTALLHELGHALAAGRRLGVPLYISVGGTGKLVRIHLRRLRMAVNALPLPFGYASFGASRASANALLLVALAGPAASFCGFVVAAVALASVAQTGVVHNLLWAAAATSLARVLLSIVPLELKERRDGTRLRTDGRVAFAALRASRAFRARERAQATAIPGSTST
jgi:hypothetical protein